MSAITQDKKKLNGNGVLGPISKGFDAAIMYGLLFVSLMLVTGKEITTESLAMPALLLFLVVNGADYAAAKKNGKSTPQWIVVGSFVLAAGAAVAMTVLL
ncbi:hypothetical protein [Jeotgalibacillus terrae]|uniref:Uncharacterized protein n=1 Tax=Jeotgalibacillus terrae TaxID=587735 RepID=A0ABW5ZKZ6_9BACL|nr:hypothetical protein [Jeotgalibacillus terrae]MBM7578222.1 hypothetical protein [Jeotgalibacillus terrae]